MTRAWIIVMRSVLEHSHDKGMEHCDYRAMEHFDEKCKEHCDERGIGAL